MSFCTKERNIVLVVNALYAGAGKILLFVADCCANAGWKVTVITLFDDDFHRHHTDNVDFINLAIKTDERFWRIKAIKKIRKLICSLNPSILCAFISDVAFITRVATLGLKVIFVSAERGDPYTLPAKWIKPLKWTYMMSNHIIFQLKGAQDFFNKTIVSKSSIIPNPYTTDREVIPYKGDRRKIIVTAGRFVEQKGFDILLRAFKIFSVNHPGYKLIIYGDGPLKDDLINLANQLEILPKVFFPGFISDIQKAISKDAVFVLSSRFEGMPNTLIEAMSIGVPTVSTDCTPGGPRFLTDGGQRGILVPVDDYVAMAHAISIIAEKDSISHYYEQRGPEIIEILDPIKIGKKWLDTFDGLL